MKRKVMSMKLLIFGLVTSFLISCNDGFSELDSESHSYSYINNSGYSFELTWWFGLTPTSYSFGMGQELVLQKNFSVAGGSCSVNGVTSDSHCLLIEADSVQITFDSNHSVIYRWDESSVTNILNISNYETERDHRDKYFTYVFTELDYLASEL